MARINGRGKLELLVDFTVDEEEARALEMLGSYNDSDLISALSAFVGERQVTDHMTGLKRFFGSVRAGVGPVIRRCDGARDVFDGRKDAREKEVK